MRGHGQERVEDLCSPPRPCVADAVRGAASYQQRLSIPLGDTLAIQIWDQLGTEALDVPAGKTANGTQLVTVSNPDTQWHIM
jgi:hypothetical protein